MATDDLGSVLPIRVVVHECIVCDACRTFPCSLHACFDELSVAIARWVYCFTVSISESDLFVYNYLTIIASHLFFVGVLRYIIVFFNNFTLLELISL